MNEESRTVIATIANTVADHIQLDRQNQGELIELIRRIAEAVIEIDDRLKRIETKLNLQSN